MKISVLAYHSENIAGNEYHNNDHIALKHDLDIIKKYSVEIISAQSLIKWLNADLNLDESFNYVVITFDDGNELDFYNWEHPKFGKQISFYNELKHSKQFTHATAFVIASSEARKTMEIECLGGNKQLGDNWWQIAEDTGMISIENHSWDHVHPTINHVKQKDNLKGNFCLIDTFKDANAQINDATLYIENTVNEKKISLFAYPYGHYNSYLTDEYFPNFQSTIKAAFTCEPKPVTRFTNVWKIPRYVCGHDWKSIEEFKNIIL